MVKTYCRKTSFRLAVKWLPINAMVYFFNVLGCTILMNVFDDTSADSRIELHVIENIIRSSEVYKLPFLWICSVTKLILKKKFAPFHHSSVHTLNMATSLKLLQ